MLFIRRIVIPISFILLLVGYWQRNALQDDMQVLPALFDEPVQTPIDEAAFETVVEDETYEVVPRYEYSITGLVVSYNVHASVSLMHRTGHQINVADYCIVWGENVQARTLSDYSFRNGEFTCFVQWQGGTQPLRLDQLSNNHLISDDPTVRKALSNIRIGDQIHLRGRLSDYRNIQQSRYRETSTDREDTGNGACETLLVDHVETLARYTSGWRLMMNIAGIVFVLSLVSYLRAPVRVNESL